MTNDERVSAWVGLFALVAGAWVYYVHVWPKLRDELGKG
jgi:uncharacterized membrane protein YiaA